MVNSFTVILGLFGYAIFDLVIVLAAIRFFKTAKNSEKKLCRCMATKKIAGVCAGIAQYFGIDANIVRLGFVLCGSCSPLIYVILSVVLPKDVEIITD